MILPTNLTQDEKYALDVLDPWISRLEFNLNGPIELFFLDKPPARELVFVYGRRGVTVIAGPSNQQWIGTPCIVRSEDNKVSLGLPIFILTGDEQAAEFLAELI